MESENVARDYVTRVLDRPSEIDAGAWNALLARQPGGPGGPFMRHDYLTALNDSGCATPATGWALQWITLWRGGELQAAAPLYLKSHSRGEYVFDWAWAEAYERNGLAYYPKGLVAVPFTPVPGPRLLAVDDAARAALVRALLQHCEQLQLSSLHLLFCSPPAARPACCCARPCSSTGRTGWILVMPISTTSSPRSSRTSARRSGRNGAR